MITVDRALEIVLEQIQPLEVETVALEDSANRILAEDVRADIDLPPFDRARMDGYAVRASDVQVAPSRLKIIGEVAAGLEFQGTIEHGQAVKIFTGAPIPRGADAVQKVEVTRVIDSSVEILEAVKPGQFITPHASEIAAGKIVAESGREIGPAELSVLASFGYARVAVSRRPRVAVMSTGSELVDVSTKPSAAQIRNSNSYTIAGYAQLAGAEVEILNTIEDTPEATRDALIRAAKDRQIVVTSGGVSMGDYDLVKASLKEIGAEIFFDKVIIRPGKPIVFARRDETYFFGLPGNPVSTSVTFNVFVKPAIRKMLGDKSPVRSNLRARLVDKLRDSSSRRSYLPGDLYINDGIASIRSLRWGGSSDLVAFMKANALIIVPEEVHEIEADSLVDVMLLK